MKLDLCAEIISRLKNVKENPIEVEKLASALKVATQSLDYCCSCCGDPGQGLLDVCKKLGIEVN